MHMGDLMSHLRHPRVDRPSGASISNWLVTLEKTVKDHNADTLYIFGHSKVGAPVTGSSKDLLALRDYFSAMLDVRAEGHRLRQVGRRDRQGRAAGVLRARRRTAAAGRLRRAEREEDDVICCHVCRARRVLHQRHTHRAFAWWVPADDMPDDPRQIIAMGGGGFSMEPDNPALDLYVLAQTRKAESLDLFSRHGDVATPTATSRSSTTPSELTAVGRLTCRSFAGHRI